MKRTRSRPDGEPRKRQRRFCLRCGRAMSLENLSYDRGTGRRTWVCRRCDLWYRYDKGVLVAYAGRRRSEWWMGTRDEWRKIDGGMLLVFDEEAE
jgi:hypothetical protein